LSSLIELRGVSKTYHTGEIAIEALRNVDLTINKQELVAIVGASGSGKSTMMNILGLLDRPTTGEFLLNGENVAAFNDNVLAETRNRAIGFVFQSFFLLPRLTAEQNVELPLFYRGVAQAEAKERANAMLAKVEIGHLARNRPRQMSGGEQQRVAIARALVGEPDIILADEPTGALDSRTGQEIINLFIHLNQVEKRTVIIITHDSNVSRQCRRVVTIRDGKIITDRLNTAFGAEV
jgi:putative ABC transport system ATP-binding protein